MAPAVLAQAKAVEGRGGMEAARSLAFSPSEMEERFATKGRNKGEGKLCEM